LKSFLSRLELMAINNHVLIGTFCDICSLEHQVDQASMPRSSESAS
jgi:hypothetical protein